MLRPRMNLLPAGVLLCLALAGCSADGSDEADPPVPPATTSATGAHVDSMRDLAPDQRLRPDALAVPANADVILAPFEGHGDRRLSFNPRRKNFSLVFSCEGEGHFDIYTDADLAEPTRCGRGLPLRLTVATDGSPQVLQVRTMPDTTWRLVVIEGDRLGPDVQPVR